MKCANCGAELLPGAVFCRECGVKVEPQKSFCRECGTKLEKGAKFCSACGARVDILKGQNDAQPEAQNVNSKEQQSHQNAVDVKESSGLYKTLHEDTLKEGSYKQNLTTAPTKLHGVFSSKNAKKDLSREVQSGAYQDVRTKNSTQKSDSAKAKAKSKAKEKWDRLDTFCKALVIIAAISVMLLLRAFNVGKIWPIVFSILQFAGLVSAFLSYKGKLKADKKWLKYALLVAVALLSVANVESYSWGNHSTNKSSYDKMVSSAVETKIGISFGSEDCIGKKSSIVSSNFRKEGFLNVTERALEDLDITEIDKEGIVEEVSVGNISVFQTSQEFYASDEVVIQYHSVKTIGVPISSKDAVAVDADTLTALFRDAGFNEISTAEVFDLDPDKTENTFESTVSINNTSLFNESDVFPLNAKIEIITHKAYDKYTLKVVVDFIPNLLFNTYDVKLDVAGSKNELKHGEDGTFEYRLAPGKYTVVFSSAEDSTVKGTADIDFIGDTDAAYKIYCHSDNINVEETYIESRAAIGEGEAMVPLSASDCKYKNYKEVEKTFSDVGFTNITTEILYDIVYGWTSEGEVKQVSVDGRTDFIRGNIFVQDAPIIITYHMPEEDDPNRPKEEHVANNSSQSPPQSPEAPKESDSKAVYYSTNNKDTVKNGDSGIYSYKNRGGSYDIYYIVDFDSGYVYNFCDGNGSATCEKVKIDSGTLNDVLIITYHDGGAVWSYGLRFRWKSQPDHLIVQDEDGYEWDYYTTDLENALQLKSSKKIIEY